MQRPPADISVNYASIRRDRQSLASWITGLLPEREQYASCPYSPQPASRAAVSGPRVTLRRWARHGRGWTQWITTPPGPAAARHRPTPPSRRLLRTRDPASARPAGPTLQIRPVAGLARGRFAGADRGRADRRRRPVDPPGGGRRRVAGGSARGAHHVHGVGEVAGLPAARGDGGGRGGSARATTPSGGDGVRPPRSISRRPRRWPTTRPGCAPS